MIPTNYAGTPFPKLLRELRLRAGFQSLSAVVSAAKPVAGTETALSKAKLSQYERGIVETIRPEILRLLAKLYGVPYDILASFWFKERYGVGDQSTEETPTLQVPKSGCMRIEQGDASITLVSLDVFQREQAQLPKGSFVIVATRRFLDDTVFFEMVSSNIARGVRYIYIHPDSQRSTYRHLVSKLAIAHPKIAQKIDGERTRFFPRYDFDSAVNQVLYIAASGEITGHIGLAVDEVPVLYQRTTERMALRIFHSLVAMIQGSKGSQLVRALKHHEAETQSFELSEPNRPLSLLRAVLTSRKIP